MVVMIRVHGNFAYSLSLVLMLSICSA